MERVIFEDTLGISPDEPIRSRTSAMRLSAVARGRNIVVTSIAKLPLVLKQGDAVLPDQPAWLTTDIGGSSPQLRHGWTVDDLIFTGWSCWYVARDDATRFPLGVQRVNRSDWHVNADNRVVIDDQVQPVDQVILIPGLHEGILTFGKDVLSDAHALARTVRTRLNSPVAQTELHQTGGDQMTTEEIDTLVDNWAAARRGARGGVAYTNEFIEVKDHGDGGDQLLIESRNAAALELARLIGVHAGMLDATAPKASLNYETTTGRNTEFVDFDLALYMTPITARLSLDDMTPAGTHVAFDLGDFTAQTPSPTGPALKD